MTTTVTRVIQKKNRIAERKSSWRRLHSRFPRIATFAARRIRLRNAPGSAYANPSAHISGIVHSCPHLGYLNYICNAYRDAVGTEYVGFAHALRLRHRLRRRRRRRRRGRTTYAYVYSSVKRTSVRAHALSAYTRERNPHAVSRVCARAVVGSRVDALSAPVRCPGAIGSEPRVCTRTRVRARKCEHVTTRCAP